MVGRWEAGGRGPQIEPTAEDDYCRQMRRENGEGWEGSGGGPITKPTAEDDYWGDRRAGPEQDGWTQGGKGNRQHRDRTAEDGWWFSGKNDKNEWTGQLAEGGCGGTTRGKANGGQGWEDKEAAQKGLGVKGGSGEDGGRTGTQRPAATSESRNHHQGRR